MGKEIGPEAYKKLIRLYARIIPKVEAKRAAEAKEKGA